MTGLKAAGPQGLLMLACACTACAPAAARATADPDQIYIREVLAIGGVGRWGRAALHTDAIEAQLVSGAWRAPQAGATLTLPDGSERTWVALTAGEDGWFRDERLAGGYAFAGVECPAERIALLEATRHSLVYINGEPRVGDVYGAEYVRIPVVLRAGRNELLFACGRGELRASLVAPPAPVFLEPRDATLPDLIAGQPADVWAAVPAVNATAEPLRSAQIVARCGGMETGTPIAPIPPLGLLKAPFRIAGAAVLEPGERLVTLELHVDGRAAASAELQLRVRAAAECHRRTFISTIDHSAQYYSVRPPQPAAESEGRPPALVVTLHGAGVEAQAQADAYASKDWACIVAPTNRRPYGFDWEDWGRLDALEVLEQAAVLYQTDPRRVYLTGHSMGGHGTWHIGATYPALFAAIAPSAGWTSFWSYAGAPTVKDPTPVEALLRRAANGSDTLALSRNYRHQGVYILHGAADDNVPVEQARTMRAHLAGYHADFAYYERPGAGHWWGNGCVDWPPLLDFLRAHELPAPAEVTHVEFVTANPAVSSRCHWAEIGAQQRWLDFSRVALRLDAQTRKISGATENVARLTLTLADVFDSAAAAASQPQGAAPVTLVLDDQTLSVAWPKDGVFRLVQRGNEWAAAPPESAADAAWRKNPRRAGPFKEAFRHGFVLVYATGGTPEENAWALARARYDAESFWYRGNGAVRVVADREFDAAAAGDRNVILYGHVDMNCWWDELAPGCPVRVERGRVQIGDKYMIGADLAMLAVYPRAGSATALVGLIGGSGLPGLRLTERVPYFMSGVALPDWIVLGDDVLEHGAEGVRGTGFFDENWRLDPAQSAMQMKELYAE